MRTNMDLRIARVRAAKSQHVLSYETGIPQSVLSLLERGLREPKPKEAARIAKALNVGVRDIFPESRQ